jgi:hypothetical protein
MSTGTTADRWLVVTDTGGTFSGYGPAAARPPAEVGQDVRRGFV